MAINFLARPQIVGVKQAIVGEYVKDAVIREGRRHVRPTPRATPHDGVARGLAFGQGQVSTRAGSHDEDRTFRGAAAGDDELVVGKERRRRGDLRTAPQPPQFLPGAGVITADVIRSVGYKFRSRRSLRSEEHTSELQ